VPAELPRQIRLQIVSPGAEPPQGEGWLHEIKNTTAPATCDRRRLLKLLSRNWGNWP
jgi:hypothetical protein